ncbi:MAG: hypothetical protein ACOYB2_19850 [Limnohabitans sp.]|jgi:hypothetical protein
MAKKFCKECGTEINGKAVACINCKNKSIKNYLKIFIAISAITGVALMMIYFSSDVIFHRKM